MNKNQQAINVLESLLRTVAEMERRQTPLDMKSLIELIESFKLHFEFECK